MHATVAEHDIIHLANLEGTDDQGTAYDDIHNFDPTSPRFGANVFASDPGTEGPWYTSGYSGEAHSQYWDKGNQAVNNLGRIIAGVPTK